MIDIKDSDQLQHFCANFKLLIENHYIDSEKLVIADYTEKEFASTKEYQSAINDAFKSFDKMHIYLNDDVNYSSMSKHFSFTQTMNKIFPSFIKEDFYYSPSKIRHLINNEEFFFKKCATNLCSKFEFGSENSMDSLPIKESFSSMDNYLKVAENHSHELKLINDCSKEKQNSDFSSNYIIP